MGRLAEVRVNLGAGASAKSAAIPTAQERHPRLRIGEAETGAGLIGRIGWFRSDCGRRRRRGVDRPGIARGSALISSSVLCLNGEGMGRLAEVRVALGAGASAKSAAIKAAQE